jgi:hypothetical protein
VLAALQNCAIAALDELEKLPAIKDLANAVAKVFDVRESYKGAIGHLKVVKASELGKVKRIKFSDVKEETFEYLLAAGEKGEKAMKLSDFIEKSGYVPVTVKDATKVKEELKDERVALYTDKTGKSILLIESEKAVELMNKNVDKPIVELYDNSVNEKLIEKLKEIKSKFEEAKAEVVEEKMFEKVVEGYATAEELDRMLIVAIAAFANVKEMEKYLGLEGGNNKQEIGQAFVNKMGEAVSMYLNGYITREERDQEISLMRIVSDMLMAASGENKEAIELINKEKLTREDILKLQTMMPQEVKVNRYVVAEAMATQVKVNKDNNVMKIGEFEINLDEIKADLETKEPKFNMFGKKNEELMKMITDGMRGQDIEALSPMMLRNTKAVAAAA